MLGRFLCAVFVIRRSSAAERSRRLDTFADDGVQYWIHFLIKLATNRLVDSFIVSNIAYQSLPGMDLALNWIPSGRFAYPRNPPWPRKAA